MKDAEIEEVSGLNRELRRRIKFASRQKSQGNEKTHNKGIVPSSSNHKPEKTGTNHERMLKRKAIREKK